MARKKPARKPGNGANPPFNVSDWGGDRLREDARWKYGTPPVGNANFAWVQHMVHHLAPSGIAGFVLANGSMSSNQSGEGEIRRKMIEADLVDCMIALPGRYVGAAELEEDDEPFDEKMQRLTNTLVRQFKEGTKLEKAIMKNLSSLGFSPKEPL